MRRGERKCPSTPKLPCPKQIWIILVYDFLIKKEIICGFGILGRFELWQGKMKKLAEYWHIFGGVRDHNFLYGIEDKGRG